MNDSNTTELNWPGGKIEKLKNMWKVCTM
jgi:hypothetical protein